ncbi:MAG: cytochrome P450 [Chloroflexota bacterium]
MTAPVVNPQAEPTRLDLRDPNFRADAYGIFDTLRAQCPMSKVRFVASDDDETAIVNTPRELLEGDSWLVTRFDEGVEAMLDDRFTVSAMRMMPPEHLEQLRLQQADNELARAMSRNLLTLDPPDHTRLRRLVQPSFTGRTIAAMDARIRRIADDLLDAAEREAAERGESAPDRAMELVRAFAYPLPVTVISDLVGIPEADRARARAWTENLLQIDRADPGQQAAVQQRLAEFAEYLKDLFERRRRDPREDLISELVRAEEDGDTLSADELLSMVFIVYVAGFVTTVNLIGNVTVGLLSHPDQLAAYRADPSLARNAVEETLRYWGPAESTLPRIALEDVEIGGVTIRRGERMRAGLAAMDRDPGKFARPEVFDITRPDANRHVAFGKGVHVCLGAPLARLEGEIAVQALFGRYPDLRLAVPREEIRWSRDLLRGFADIPLRF